MEKKKTTDEIEQPGEADNVRSAVFLPKKSRKNCRENTFQKSRVQKKGRNSEFAHILNRLGSKNRRKKGGGDGGKTR